MFNLKTTPKAVDRGRCRRTHIWLFALLIPSLLWARPLSKQDVQIRWAVQRYQVNPAILRAILRYENGPLNSEAGFNEFIAKRSNDVYALSDPTMPTGAEQHALLARRIVSSVQNFVFSDPYLRREWIRWFARHYHDKGDEKNKQYAKELLEVWKEERARLSSTESCDGYME